MMITNNLQQIRLAKGLTQRALADMAGVHWRSIQDHENRPGVEPLLPFAKKVAKALGVDIQTIWPDDE